jgi:hypothetical protein
MLRGSPPTNVKDFSAKSRKILSLNRDIQLLQLDKKYPFHRKDACKCQSSIKEIFSKGGAK